MLRNSFLLAGTLFFALASFSQKAAGDTLSQVIYNSLQSALQNPDNVYSLQIDGITNPDSLEMLGEFPNLKSLQLKGIKGSVAPNAISQLTQLQELRFINDEFDSIPQSFKRLTNLKRIDLVSDSNLNLESTFRVLNQLPSLTELRIEGFDNASLNDKLVFPAHIQILSIRNNHLDRLPLGVTKLNQLELLDIGENDFQLLPMELIQLSNLKTLYLDHESNLFFEQTFDLLHSFPKLEILHIDKSIFDQAETKWKGKTPEQLLLNPNLFNASPYYMPNTLFTVPQPTVPTGSGRETINIPISK